MAAAGDNRSRRPTCGLVAVVCLGLLAAAPALAQRAVALTPVWQDTVLACRLTTEGLPGPRIASSLASGLTSAIVIDLELRRRDGGTVARSRVPVRLTYDLWGESYEIAWGDRRLIVTDADSLRRWLRELPPLPVAGASQLARIGERTVLVLRAGLTLQPIAPAERRRLAGAVSGRDPDEPDRRERTIGMDRLIRFFFKEREEASPLEVASPPFTLREVPR